MKLINRFIGIIAAFFCVHAYSAPLDCGDAKAELTFEKSDRFFKNEVASIITVSLQRLSVALRFDAGIDFIGMECRKTRDGKPMIVFQAYCGGSACRDLDNYGIVDPKDLRVLLTPDDNNHNLARKILGTDPEPIENMTSIEKIHDKLYPP